MNRKLQIAALATIMSLMPMLTAEAQSLTTTTTTTTGSFDTLSPGNQKIAQALYSAEPSPPQLTLNDIADLKGTTGWGNVFKQMKADGLIDAKNLGQIVSGYEHTLTHGATLRAGNSGEDAVTVTNGFGHSSMIGTDHSNGIGIDTHGGEGIGRHEDTMVTTAGGRSITSAGAINTGGNSAHGDLGGGGFGGGHGH